MAKRMEGTTPKQDGYRMPGEFETQECVWMLWPWWNGNWRLGAKPAQEAFCNVARAIAKHEPVKMCVPQAQYENAIARLGGTDNISIIEMENNDSWLRDTGATFLVNDNGGLRAVDWGFNAYGGLVDGLYFPWDKDAQIARKMCEIAGADSYKPMSLGNPEKEFILEGGSFHVDGEGTCLTTEMCLLHPSRNPEMTKEQIEELLKDYLNVEKVIWVKDGIDPYETNGHIDDVACYVRPGEVLCIYTEDETHPFYKEAQAAYKFLCEQTDAKGRKLKVHKLCVTKEPCYLKDAATIDYAEGAIPREEGEVSIASYLNFLIVNGAIILPQYGDENDELAVRQVQEAFGPDYVVEGVMTTEVAYGGGNIHCITQQQPKAR